MWFPPRRTRRTQRLWTLALVVSCSLVFLLLKGPATPETPEAIQQKYPLLWEHVQLSEGTGGAWYLPAEWVRAADETPSTIVQAAQLALDYTNSTDGHTIAHSTIPLIIHQQWGNTNILQWPDSICAGVEKWLATAVAEGMAFLFWTDDGIASFLEEYEPEFIDTYRSLTWNVERSDVFRVLAVKWIGGIYADMDTHLLRSPSGWVDERDIAPWSDPVTGTLHNDTAPIGAIFGLEADFDPNTDLYWRRGYQYPVQLTQWALAAARGHPVLSRFTDYIRNHLDAKAPGYRGADLAATQAFQQLMATDPVGTTGPAAITETVMGWLNETAGLRWNALSGREDDGRSKQVKDVLVLPITGFSPRKHSWNDWNNMGAKPLTHPDARLSHQAVGTWKSFRFRVEAGKLCRTVFGACRDWPRIS